VAVQPLAAEPGHPPLTDVILETPGEDDVAMLRIRVPEGHPPGVYNGMFIDDETSRPVGTLSVRIGRG
jgi:hypothetical protein